MVIFSLTKGGKSFDFDSTGKVSRSGSDIGTWTTSNDDANNIIVTEESGTKTTFAPVWKFNQNNQLEVSDGAALLYNFHSQNAILPDYRIENAILVVAPDRSKSFNFNLNGEWNLNEQLDLTVTFGSATSVIDGAVEDNKSRFIYKFLPKAGTANLYNLTFAGSWTGRNENGAFIMTFHYKRKKDGSTLDRTFALPRSATFDRSINQLVFDYEKNGLKRRLQFVGELKITPNLVINYKLDQQKSGDGKELVGSTSLSVQAKLNTDSFKADLSFELLKLDGTAGTQWAIAGKFEKDLSGSKLSVAFGYKFQKSGGVVKTNTFTLGGQLKLKNDGATLVWVFNTDIVTKTTTIEFGVDQFRLGDFLGNGKLKVVGEGGHIKEVHMLFGVNF